ncbi:Rib/alpha-like domain-containing protein [Lactobacillus taiwanensis]|uniref:Rib/alpha-like domain-containing protein n=6 Tax=Lactobacillaceae TaxID=33958 RepID=UPI00214BAB90|nr:Rib/alpha-like domain-containing protein [Lactobacillus taiwanensis]MCR1903220.1 Rib/alpha-like domain-containing protein [Lactobacillus taiwanensis]
MTISNKEDSTNVENKTAVLNTDKKQTSLTKDSLRDEKVAAASVESTATKNLRGTQSQDVNDWQGFVNAMNDSSVGTIKLTSDITVANKGTNVNGIHRPQPLINSGKMNLTGSNISGGLDIDGQNHTINFEANYLSFDTNNQKNSNPWDIAFKNLTINADGYDNSWGTLGGAFSPIYMGGDDINTSLLAKNKVTFENVTADVKNGAFYNTTMAQQVTDNPYTTVTFKGNNNITVEAVNVAGNQLYNYSSAVSASHIVFADGTNTVFNVSSAKTNNDQNAGGNILRAKVEDSSDTTPAIDVQEGATVTLNGKSTDVKGMLVNNAITGTVQVDGNLNANMADGHSMAIWAGNLNIGKAGVVNINTKQSNDGSGLNGVTNYNGYHFAPISLGVGFTANVTNADANTLDNQGKLTIVRSGDNTSTSPLISFGSGGAGVLNGTFTLNVTDGATLNLQDSAQSSIAGATTNTPNIGLITMWSSGSSSTANNINITNPAYVNLQRTGKQTGTLIRLENLTNHVTVQSNGANNPLPLAQWDEGNYNNPSYYWYINNLTSHNNWGNNSISGFAKQGQTAGANKAGEAKFLHSNGIVTMGGSQAGLNQYQYTDGTITQGQPDPGVDYETPYLNKFLNNFNWWTPQQISMGTNLETKVTPTDADKYQPVVQTIDGNTSQTLKDLTAKAGIKGLLSSNGTVTTDLSSVKSVSWYDAATDANEWKSVMGNEAEPTNPTGNLKTSDKSAWAKVTYTDGSVDFANIPLKITEPMAKLYIPSYKPVNVEQGETATGDPSFTDQDGKDVTAPAGTTFTTGTDTPDWASIDPSTGTVTVEPSTEVTPGAYNVPVTVTYPDKSTDETTVPVIVTKAGQTVTWGDNGAVVTTVDTSKLNAHETTENSQVLSPATVVTAEGYELTDGKISTTATPITIDPSTVSWTTTPNTNVETATAAGKEITASVTVDFTNNDAAKNILGSKNGVVTTNPFTIDAKGAGAKNVATPVNVALGSALTNEQFKQLVDNNIPTDEIASTTWETKPDANGNGGVIKIAFTDKDANGNPTYLNIDVPATSIKVTTDAEDHNPEGQNVSTKVGETPDAKKGIKNPDTLPSGTTYTWQNTPNTTTPGKKSAVIVVTYPDGSKDEVPTNVVVNAKPEIKTITTTVGGNPAATEGIANLNNGGTTPVDGYPTSATWTTKPDTSKPGATTGTATVTYPDGTTETVTIPVAVNGQGDVTVIDNGHVFSLHANNVVTHKTSDKNIIGEPVIENFKLSYYQGGQNYSKPYIYTLNADKTAYVLTQTGDNPAGVTVDAPQSINASDIKISWTADGTVLFNNALGPIKGNGQPSSLASDNNGGTKTITYTNWVNNQFGYPKYSAVVNSSGVNWPIYGKGPVSTYPFPSVYIYGAEANGTIPSVNSDVSDLKTALGDASKLVNTNDLTADHNSEISSVNWQTLPSLAEANAKAPATVRINFTDGSYLDVPVAVNVIKVDQGVDDKTNHDIYRDITRTINVEGESTPVVQHVIYSRAKITDLSKPAGQQISYTDWAAAKNSEGQAVTNFPQYEVTKPGYTATATGATIETVDGKQYVPASATITPDSSNETVNVTYTANEHTLVINYVDGNGTVVGTYNVPGKTNETVNVDVPGHVPTNWKLVPKQQVIGSYKFGSNDPQPVDYKVEHGTEVVPVDKNNKDTYRKITQTIQEVPAGKTNADMHVVRTASVEFERTGVKDLVTGKTTWNAWNSNSETFPVYNIKEQKGYDSYVNGVKATEVAAVTVNPDSSNITDSITYVKQAATPVPYDPSNKDMNKSVTRTINYEVPAGHEAIAPVTQTVEYTRDVNGVAGYQDPVTGDITWNPWHVKSGKAEFTSAVVEQIKGYDSYVDGTKSTEVPAAAVTEKDGVPQNGANVTVSYQKQADTVVPYDPSNKDMNMSVTRTINYEVPAGHEAIAPVTQTVEYTRDVNGVAGYQDPVTGEITWNAWHVKSGKAEFASASVEQIKGYDSYVDGTKATEVSAAAVVEKDGVPQNGAAVNVTYTANEHTLVINYVDGNGTVVGTYNVPGKTDETVNVDVPGHVPTNWKLVPNQQTINSYKFGSDDPQPVDYKVEHGTKDITPTDPSVNPTDPKYKDMFTTVSRDIYQTKPGETRTKIDTQYVDFGRNGVEDLVTGVVTGTGDWKVGKIENNKFVEGGKAEFASENAPQIKGYDSYVDGVKSTEVPVASALKDGQPVNGAAVNVTYTANEHTLVINYVDGNGTVVGTYNVPGKTNETVNVDVPGHVPTNWKLVPKQQVIGSYKFGSNDPQPVDYKVEHGTKVVPVDKNDKDTYRKITQTIQEVPAGKTNADMHVVRTASVEFERTGVKDLVTGDIAWNAWNSNSETFPVYNIKEQKGYDSYVNGVKATEVAAVTVDPDSQNITDTITYVKQAATPVPYDPSNKDMNKSVTRTINYEVPAGHEAIAPVTQTVEYTRDVNGVAGYQDPVTGDITWNPWHVKSGKAEFASASVEQIKGYDSYVDGTKTTEVPAAAVTEKDGVPQNGANVTVSYQKQADTPVPYKPGQEGVNDDMNQYVTRTIVVHEPDQDPVSHDQTVHFTREDAQGNAGYTDPVTGKITWNAWHVAGELNQANGTWAEFNAPTVKGYTPSQAKVAAEEVTAETKNVIVDIKYAPVAPTGQNVTTKVGEVPDASQGIANKDDLPDGTKYSWKTTPDVSTEGEKPAVVIVTYPGGSPVEVPVTVTVTKNPTDADKYTPEGQDVNTKTGVVPNPAEGIKNKSDLPDGTKYTWKDTPDVTTAGDKPATVVVSYPDGSKDEVPVTIHVTNPATDADKYTPEGQDVNTKTGVVPNPAEGIKNKSDLPDGTKYTWKDTPDVTKPGESTGVIVVTYPDGSKDEVPVTIHVTNPATDADKYTPEGQDVNTKTGVVPNPAEGIKNKSDLPDGTKYTWKDTPDVTKPGESTGVIVVTYPDGSKDEVPVKVVVNTNDVTPETQPIHTTLGVLPNPADAIKNKDEMPVGTKYTWKEVPNVNTLGEHTGVITVTYPDGSSVDLTVKVYVDAVAKENNSNNTAQVITKHVAETNEKKTSATSAQQINHSEKVTLPQTGAKSENAAGILGLAIAAVGSLFGLAADKKRRDK